MMRCAARPGFSFAECLLASAILGFVVLAVFEGVIVAARIAHENADVLAAEAVAWDAVWKRFNEDFSCLAVGAVGSEDLAPEAAPQLARYDTAPQLTIRITAADEAGFSSSAQAMKKITADLAWGDERRRRSLAELGQCPQVFRGSLGRAN